MKPSKHKKLAKFSFSVGSIVLCLFLLRMIAPGPTYFIAALALIAICVFFVASAISRWVSNKSNFHHFYR